MLLLGVFAGRVAEHCRIPHITGYIIIGALCGPDVWQLVDASEVSSVQLVKHIAIGLIALMAGAEIRLSWLKKRFTGFCVLVGLQSLLVPLSIMGLLVGVHAFDVLPDFSQALRDHNVSIYLVGLLVGFVALANSPMVVVSIIKNMGAKGPVAETAMGVSVLKDVIVIAGFAILVAILLQLQSAGMGTSGSEGSIGDAVLHAGGIELGAIAGSVVLGLLIGQGLRVVSNITHHHVPWLLVGLSLLITAAQKPFHIEPLFCLLAAGFSAENIGKRHEQGTHNFEESLLRVAEPVFVLFFVAAGLKLNLNALVTLFPVVIAFVAVRMAAKWFSMRLGSRLSKQEPEVGRYAWTALVPQAGVTLSLAAIIGDEFGDTWGGHMSTLIVATVALHEFIGPILFIGGLKRAGEAEVG